MSESRHCAILRIDAEILVRMLRLPEDTRVDGVFVDFAANAQIICLRLEQADLPLVAEGEIVPLVNAEFTDGCAGPTFQRWC